MKPLEEDEREFLERFDNGYGTRSVKDPDVAELARRLERYKWASWVKLDRPFRGYNVRLEPTARGRMALRIDNVYRLSKVNA